MELSQADGSVEGDEEDVLVERPTGEKKVLRPLQTRKDAVYRQRQSCERCKTNDLACTFSGRKSMAKQTSHLEGRMNEMEGQIQAVQTSVDRLASALLANLNPAPINKPAPINNLAPNDNSQCYARSVDFSTTPGNNSLLSNPSPAVASIMAVPGAFQMQHPSAPLSMDMSAVSRESKWQEDEDPLQAGATSAPFREMLSRAAAVSDVDRDTHSPARQHKRRRGESPDRPLTMHEERDPVAAHLCSEVEGRRLFDMFMRRSHDFLPVLDPICDTWESLRSRSPFAITVIIMAAKMADDCEGPISELQQQCRARAENMATMSLFSSSSSIETLQATMILSCWSEHAWRPGVHALSLAMDLGIHRCLPQIVHRRSPVTDDDFAAMRTRVVGARCWLALLKMRLEMAYNLGLPLLNYEDDQLIHARAFLGNAMTNLGDCRLVSACELLALRIPLHCPPGVEAQHPGALDNTIRDIHRKTFEWESFWHGHYAARGVPQSHVLRELLTSEVSHAVLHTNIKVVFGMRSAEDVAAQSTERQEWLLAALRAAQRQVDLCLHRRFRDTFRYANSYTFVSMAFTARCLIRLATLCSMAADPRQISRDVSDMADLLNMAPGFAYGQLLRAVLDKARDAQILPPITRPPSPQRPDAELGASFGEVHSALPEEEPLGDMSLNWAEYYLSGSYVPADGDLDFVYNLPNNNGSDPLAALLSFPPLNFMLEGSGSSGPPGI